MTGLINKTEDTLTIELFANTYNNQEKFDNLLHEVKEKYNLKTVNAVMGRMPKTENSPRKLTLTFNLHERD